MAASGIQEHNEARRKERVIMRASKRDQEVKAAIASGQMQALYSGHQNENNNNQGGYSSYEREVQSRSQFRVVGSPPGIQGTGAQAVDRFKCYNAGMFGRAHYFNVRKSAAISTNAYRCPLMPEIDDDDRLSFCDEMSDDFHLRPISPCVNTQYQSALGPRDLVNQESNLNIKLWSAPYTYTYGDRRCRLPINEARYRDVPSSFGAEGNDDKYQSYIYVRCPPPQRRMELYNNQQQEYSAKIPHRFRNFDYKSQW